MPAGMYLSWLADHVAPFDFRVNAAMLVLMQLLANVGLLVMLVAALRRAVGDPPPARDLPVLHDLASRSRSGGRPRSTSSRSRSRCSGGWRPTWSYLRTTRPGTWWRRCCGCLLGLLFYEKCLPGPRRLRHRDAGLLHDGRPAQPRCRGMAALPRRHRPLCRDRRRVRRVLRGMGPQLQPAGGRQRRLGRGHHQHGASAATCRPFSGGRSSGTRSGSSPSPRPTTRS